VSLHGVCSRRAADRVRRAHRGPADGSLVFDGVATAATDFVPARTGFVVLHPLTGVAGRPVEVEHVDGTVESSTFPALVDPVQPFLAVRALTHEVMPGLKATVRMEGDSFEMEDHRNWTDASFKTYVRPLALPWPYTLKAGETVRQSVRLALSGRVPRSAGGATGDDTVQVKLGRTTRDTMPQVGLGMPAEEDRCRAAEIDLVARIEPRLPDLPGSTRVPAMAGASFDGYGCWSSARCRLRARGRRRQRRRPWRRADAASRAACATRACRCPRFACARPRPQGRCCRAARAARAASCRRCTGRTRRLPRRALGGGMFSFFTELNRKRPPAEAASTSSTTDTCPIVHAADDRSVMRDPRGAAVPGAHRTQLHRAHAVPDRAERDRLPRQPAWRELHAQSRQPAHLPRQGDPRQRGLFGAAWTLAYVASFAPTGVEAVSLGAPTGPLGLVHRPGDTALPWYDTLRSPRCIPPTTWCRGWPRGRRGARHGQFVGRVARACAGLPRAGGDAAVAGEPHRAGPGGACRPRRGRAVRHRARRGELRACGDRSGRVPGRRQAHRPARLVLGAYAVALVCIDDA
jgi:hypothetical protein